MARAGIYKSEVLRARDRLISQGKYPSIDAVRVELGNSAVPHGVFERAPGVRYVAIERFVLAANPLVFVVLTGIPLEDYKSVPASLAMDEPGFFEGHNLPLREAL